MTELVANFTLNNNPLNADFELSEGVELNALFQIGDAIWGKIAGDINDQTDLKDIIDTLSSQIEGNHSEITNINTTISGYGNIVTHNVAEFATAAQGAKADTALQPNDNITELVNNAGYITSTDLNGYATQEWVGEQGYITGIDSTEVTTALGYIPVNPSDLSNVATSGSYNDLTNKPTINDLTTTAQQSAINSGATSTNIGQIATNASDISAINDLIPSQATSSNQLADKNFVNSSIATNTANFIGTFNSVADLEAYSGTLTNNDYAFVVTTDTAGNTLYDRYKYTTATIPASWQFEYELNNSSFTADQWAAINSGITTNDVTLIGTAVQPSDLATVATSGSYNDLLNKPTIPTVNNAKLTIQKNGTTVKTFTANASSNVTCNITVPTDTNDLTNGAGYITSSALSGYQTTSNLVTSISSLSTDTQYPSAKCVYDLIGDIETALNTINSGSST